MPNPKKPRISLCTFSCQQQWRVVQKHIPGTPFHDAASFLDYSRTLGAEGVQTAIHTAGGAKAVRSRVEAGACFEGEVRLPVNEGETGLFNNDVQLVSDAGGSVARAVLTSNRRYESFKSLVEFREFQMRSLKTLQLAEPVLRKHGVRLALENHKDQTAAELIDMMHRLSSDWIGVCVDVGNNIALLEEPLAVVEQLAPFAASVHFKDMAVQPYRDGFLLSEVPLGTGFLDLPRIIATLCKASPGICFNLEMATRNPLKIPCLTPSYWAAFPERPATVLAHAMAWIHDHPVKQPPPSVGNKPVDQVLAEEEANNRACLAWMKDHIG